MLLLINQYYPDHCIKFEVSQGTNERFQQVLLFVFNDLSLYYSVDFKLSLSE